eukprot:4380298-Karenia_brevis.AAC.1
MDDGQNENCPTIPIVSGKGATTSYTFVQLAPRLVRHTDVFLDSLDRHDDDNVESDDESEGAHEDDDDKDDSADDKDVAEVFMMSGMVMMKGALLKMLVK